MPNPHTDFELARHSARPVALVTGATGGMGSAIVRELATTHRVIAVGRGREELAELADETGAVPWAVDLTDGAALAEHAEGLDRLDVLVHAAARGGSLSVTDARAEDWAEHFAVNVTAPAELTRLTLPLLRASQGTVVFIGSGAGTRPVPGSAVYTATKHALRGVADVLRIDEEPFRVRVVTLAPGQTDTAMLRANIPSADYRPERYIRPESVAETVRFVVDAPADVQLTDIAVRPRQEIARL
ncbi:NADP-dependent 3-hydroxy acid dehydrogenase YdfG [Leucobacter komagatae]|uniref:NADP-dependent 3-hydroxy acid dehydrogenase YdfG n=1 Tax=Leucobacter komagatae TaxID=55969 RepID=A0A542Y8G1_9MICO|nr:SDR family oxidoreductase [Leucobacter komagatae]TQL44365.1 NADP-dependent 3-hydroxy acid dehydrogenase YdfG [Leucobacter komagatae]